MRYFLILPVSVILLVSPCRAAETTQAEDEQPGFSASATIPVTPFNRPMTPENTTDNLTSGNQTTQGSLE